MAHIPSPSVVLPTEIGSIRVAFVNSAEAVHVTNDFEQPVTYAETDYRVSLLLLAPDWDVAPRATSVPAEWEIGTRAPRYSSIKRQDNPRGPEASVAVWIKIAAVCMGAVKAYIKENPEILSQTRYAHANNELDALRSHMVMKTEELEDLLARATRLEEVMAQNAPAES